MVLTMFMLSFGYHAEAWRRPDSRAEEAGRLSLVRDMAQAAEAAKLHAIFFADSNESWGALENNVRSLSIYEPISTIGALSGYTEKLGFIGTSSTTFSHPYSVARQFAGLDLLNGGRTGWNIVTSINGEANFGSEPLPLPEDRYRRATEFVEVVRALWDSWDADAVIADRDSVRWLDPSRVRAIDHAGEFFTVRGPLSMPRSPQGQPLLVQAGQSPAGIDLGSSVADAIYTVQPDRDASIAFYADYKDRVRAKGRDPERVKILPGIMPFLGETLADAQEMAADLARYIDVPTGRAHVARMLDVDLSDLEQDDMIPMERLPDGPQRMQRWRLFRDMAAEKTVGELMVELSRAVGHQWMIGTPSTVADRMIDWFERRACDGFNLNPPSVPHGMQLMFDLLVPELQERGYFQDEYRGDTLRERMGVELPSGR